MLGTLNAWGSNRVFMAWLVACLVSQGLKMVLGAIRLRRFDFRWLIGTGGMPSTHAAGVTALSLTIGFQAGFDSPLFAAAVAFTIITLFDAQGVRRWSGRQAQILNKMMEDMYFKRRIQEQRLKELLGHTPIEVLAGMGIGVVTALALR
ncbi:MAG: divergent PAP2 family protein [Candidatus Omnitrophica bacterium]|nr:divergent PAP2 family protein [Candidatus Omnitrophota bacterium]MBI3082848.1 divergent PAP2 family protein [Candidatus Omnitrophota bacterium]